MGLFGKSFKEKVNDALDGIRGSGLQVNNLEAQIEGKVVTLKGSVPDMESLKQVITEFNKQVDTENTINNLKIKKKEQEAPVVEESERIHEVVSGDTLGKLAKTYYGKSSLYMKIFEANTDILKDPNLIKVGQKLKIPR